MAVSAGRAELPVSPVLDKGFSSKLATQMAGPATRAAKTTGQETGRRFGREFERSGDDSARRFGVRFNKRLGGGFSASTKIASVAAGAIGSAFAAVQIGGFLKGAIDEAREAAKVGRQTAAVIKATGGVAKVSARDVDKLADRLSALVGVDDEVIATGANMLLTFKGVRNEVGKGNNIFDQASVAALDMTAAMGKGVITQEGLQASTIRLGKALNDPLKGMTALTRVGVTFTEGQKKQVKALVEAGRTMDAQKIILAELKSEFGGAAKAAADPWQRVGVAMKNVQEDIGTLLLPALKSASEFITGKLIPGVQRWVGAFRDDLAPHLGRMKDAWNDNKDAVLGLVTGLAGSTSQMGETAGKARTLADSVVAISNAAGDASRLLNSLGLGLNKTEAASDSFGIKVHKNLVRPMGEFFAKSALGQGTLRLYRGILGDVKADLADVGVHLGQTTQATERLRIAGDRHVGTLRAEKDAVNALKSALAGEEASELDVRQAKLNVSSAQARLTELKKAGKKGSIEYKQAQIDLKRAQIDLAAKTGEYKTAQQRAAAATSGAMRAAQNATRPMNTLGGAVFVAGKKIKTMRGEMAQLQSRSVKVTVSGIWNPPKGVSTSTLIAISKGAKGYGAAKGARITAGTTPTADDVPIMVSKGEAVVPTRSASKPEFKAWAASERIPGYARGGKIGETGDLALRSMRGLRDATGRTMTAMMSRALSAVLKRALEGGGNAAIKAFIRSTDPLPYIWGGAGPGGYDCSGLVSAVLGKMTGRGGGHGQRYFTTGTIHAGILGIKPGLGGILQIGVTPKRGHMAGRYGGLGFEAESTRTGIKIGSAASPPESFARKFHLAKGGPIDERLVSLLARSGADIGGDPGRLRINGQTFDRGGTLSPGLNLLANRTGRPEPLVPASKQAPIVVNVTVNGAVGNPREIARVLAPAIRQEIKEAQRRSGVPAREQVR